MGRSQKALKILTFLLMLTACGGPGPALRVYSLQGPMNLPRSLPTGHSLPGVLTVMRFSADHVLSSRKIAWRASPTGLTVGNYADHLWSEPPAMAMQTGVEQCLRLAHAAESVVMDTTPAATDWLLSGRLVYFEQQLTGPGGAAQARVAADFVLTRMRDARHVVWQDSFDMGAPLPDSRPEHVAEGIQRALNLMCPRLVSGISSVEATPRQSCRRDPTPPPGTATFSEECPVTVPRRIRRNLVE